MAPGLLSCLQKTVEKQEKGLAVAPRILIDNCGPDGPRKLESLCVVRAASLHSDWSWGSIRSEMVKHGLSEEIFDFKGLALSAVCGSCLFLVLGEGLPASEVMTPEGRRPLCVPALHLHGRARKVEFPSTLSNSPNATL